MKYTQEQIDLAIANFCKHNKINPLSSQSFDIANSIHTIASQGPNSIMDMWLPKTKDKSLTEPPKKTIKYKVINVVRTGPNQVLFREVEVD